MRRTSRIASLLIAASALACESGRTEVLVVVDTDYSVPDELDEVRVELIGPSGEPRRSEGPITGAGDLPKSLALVDTTHQPRDVRVTVTGLLRGANVVQRRAVFAFVPYETRVLRMDLWRSCAGVSCDPDQTCGDDGCRPVRVQPDELRVYPGGSGRFDAGTDDAGVECPAEVCNDADDDCDGHVDEGFALDRDPAHCGACGNACAVSPENAASSCVSGACEVRCDPGFLDCDGELGCEAALGDRASCGSCSVSCEGGAPLCAQDDGGFTCVAACGEGTTECAGACVDLTSSPLRCGGCATRCLAPANAIATCVASTCGFSCDDGFGDCDGDPANGCESSLRELAHCGSCGNPCARDGAVVTCTRGMCETLGCASTRADCDRDPSNGCEAHIASNIARCGGCNVVCPSGDHATAVCREGRCALACELGWADCDGRADNGCETDVSAPASCGGCAIVCSDPAPYCEAVGPGFACTDGCAAGDACMMSCVDTTRDPSHCGACGAACAGAINARTVCASSSCSLECDAGWSDCDSEPGCETFTAGDVDHCGACGTVCPSAPGATRACDEGACGLRCLSGYGDCNHVASDGCEAPLASDLDHCGRCENVCPNGPGVSAAACEAGVCRVASCMGSLGDCDRNALNGCETDTSADPAHCGECGRSCPASRRCCGGVCVRPADCPLTPASP
jgi:hypothetical protein